ncbi:MAG TPA: acyltransferase [Smithellaceae bacterium]|nr:acyltransferase [Smithellaceae bacterium]
MKRYLFYLIKFIAILAKALFGRFAYMTLFTFALKQRGVSFTGTPRYIDHDAYIDAEGGLSIGNNVVVSTRAIILTHDYSYTTGLEVIGERPDTDIEIRLPVKISNNVFIGSGAIILPGATIEDNVIIGAGALVRGLIKSNSVIVGNPGQYLCDIKEWIAKKKQNTNHSQFFKDKK